MTSNYKRRRVVSNPVCFLGFGTYFQVLHNSPEYCFWGIGCQNPCHNGLKNSSNGLFHITVFLGCQTTINQFAYVFEYTRFGAMHKVVKRGFVNSRFPRSKVVQKRYGWHAVYMDIGESVSSFFAVFSDIFQCLTSFLPCSPSSSDLLYGWRRFQ